MNKLLLTFAAILCLAAFISTGSNYSYAQEGQEEGIEEAGPLLLLREAKEYRDSTVAVEAYLTDNILEAKVTARMYGTKPKIHNVLVVGPKLGRLSIESKEVLLATVEDEEPYSTSKKDKGFISFAREKTKQAEGTLTREMMVFEIPRDKVMKGRRYEFWVQIMSMQKGGKYKTFKFDLEDLAGALSKSKPGS